MGHTTQKSIQFFLKITLGALLVVLSWGFVAQFAAAAAPDAPAEGHVLICHVPPNGPLWLWVDDAALGGHLDHGDYVWTADAECGGQPYPSDDDDCDELSNPTENDDEECDDDDSYWMHLPVVHAR